MKLTLTSLALGLSLLAVDARPSEACGVKLTVKMSKAGKNRAAKASNRPVRANEPRTVVTARVVRTPVAAGPTPDRKVVVAKQVEVQTTPAKTEPAPPPTPPTVEPTTPTTVATKEDPPVTTPTVKEAKPVKEKVVKTTTPKTEVAVGGSLSAEMYFGLGNASISENDAKIAKSVKWLNDHADVSIIIEGHADPSGSPEANMALSQSRAEAVRDALVAGGVDASRIEVAAFGDTKVKYGRSDGRNRRVAIHKK